MFICSFSFWLARVSNGQIKIKNDGIRTTDLEGERLPLDQLCRSLCPNKCSLSSKNDSVQAFLLLFASDSRIAFKCRTLNCLLECSKTKSETSDAIIQNIVSETFSHQTRIAQKKSFFNSATPDVNTI